MSNGENEIKIKKSRGLWGDAMRRVMKNRLAVVCLAIFIFTTALCVVGLFIAIKVPTQGECRVLVDAHYLAEVADVDFADLVKRAQFLRRELDQMNAERNDQKRKIELAQAALDKATESLSNLSSSFDEESSTADEELMADEADEESSAESGNEESAQSQEPPGQSGTEEEPPAIVSDLIGSMAFEVSLEVQRIEIHPYILALDVFVSGFNEPSTFEAARKKDLARFVVDARNIELVSKSATKELDSAAFVLIALSKVFQADLAMQIDHDARFYDALTKELEAQKKKFIEQDGGSEDKFVFITRNITNSLQLMVPAWRRHYTDQNAKFTYRGPSWTGAGDEQKIEEGAEQLERPYSLCGTDDLGRDIFSRTLAGGRVSLLIGLCATFVSVLIGVLIGSLSGYKGGWIDNLIMRGVDVLYGIPFLFLIILIMSIVNDLRSTNEFALLGLRDFVQQIGPFPIIFVVIGAFNWMTLARIARGQVLSIRENDYVLAARALGAGTPRILLKHIIPNLLGPIIVYTTLTVPSIILLESFLSFLGLGIQEPHCSWGSLANGGFIALSVVKSHWWLLFFPCAMMAASLFSLNIIGDGLRDALDPRMKK
ncbi:MAG: ABC transporter permease subunit [Planctomycetes bacterium]|nr:ABC transporter permease subunit [Planctomycetota bacterium]